MSLYQLLKITVNTKSLFLACQPKAPLANLKKSLQKRENCTVKKENSDIFNNDT